MQKKGRGRKSHWLFNWFTASMDAVRLDLHATSKWLMCTSTEIPGWCCRKWSFNISVPSRWVYHGWCHICVLQHRVPDPLSGSESPRDATQYGMETLVLIMTASAVLTHSATGQSFHQMKTMDLLANAPISALKPQYASMLRLWNMDSGICKTWHQQKQRHSQDA